MGFTSLSHVQLRIYLNTFVNFVQICSQNVMPNLNGNGNDSSLKY